MNVFYPAYYHDFHCIAGDCPDSCCKEWAVDVDAQAAAYYRQLSGALGDRLRSVMEDADDGAVMILENGRCPMWREDGLCRIQAELGHDALCKTCRDFPRLRHDYGDFVELGLELSCPEAARLIMNATDSALDVSVQPGETEPEYDRQIMDLLQKSRETVLDFLDSARAPLGEVLAAILLYAHDVQAALDGAEDVLSSPESCLDEVSAYRGKGDLQAIVAFFKELDILTTEWRCRLAQPLVAVQWFAQLRALMRYMILRYWLQTVSDFDLICRVKLAVTACLLVGALGGDSVQTAQFFSKEIENDPDNMETILSGAYTSPALTDANLLALLLA